MLRLNIKNQFLTTLFILIQILPNQSHSSNIMQTVIYRAATASFINYKNYMKINPQFLTPQESIAKALATPELTAHQQDLLNQTLENMNAQSLKSFLEKTKLELMTVALREVRQEIKNKISEIDSIDLQSHSHIKNLQVDSAHIQKLFSSFRKIKGGEDLQVYRDGQLIKPNSTFSALDQAQWLMLSSQWKVKIIYGTWAELQKTVQHEFIDSISADQLNWAQGKCHSFEINNQLMFTEEDRVYFNDDCIQNKDFHELFNLEPISASQKTVSNKWSWLAIGIVFLSGAALNAQGKTIEFRF